MSIRYRKRHLQEVSGPQIQASQAWPPDGQIHHERACLDRSCRDKLEKARNRKGGRSGGDGAGPTGDPSPDAANVPRVTWHGEHFRELFYQQKIRERTENVPWSDERMLRMLLFALLTHCGDTLGAWFARRHGLTDADGQGADDPHWYFFGPNRGP